MKISSQVFQNGGVIPSKYTCDDDKTEKGTIPPLVFENVPEETKSLALIMDDPDASVGNWDHWIVWNIPANTKGVEEGMAPQGVCGSNSWNETGYGGPCPGSGSHRYIFKLYALDTELTPPPGATKGELEDAMKDHVLASAETVGIYSREK